MSGSVLSAQIHLRCRIRMFQLKYFPLILINKYNSHESAVLLIVRLKTGDFLLEMRWLLTLSPAIWNSCTLLIMSSIRACWTASSDIGVSFSANRLAACSWFRLLGLLDSWVWSWC